MNLLFVLSDQQNRYALSCMGNENLRTPYLDALASRGTLFRRAYSNDPVCGPFRGSLLTGQYTSRCRVRGNGMPLPEGTATFADAYNAAGFQTGWVGKWHLGGNGNVPIPRPLRGGFQRFKAYQCYNGFYKDVCFYDEHEREHRYDRHRTEVTTDIALGELDAMAGAGKPFALMVSYQAPHYPVQPSPEYAAMYAGQPVARRPNCRDIDPHTPTHSPRSPRPVEDDPDFQRYGNNLDEYIRLYNAMCTQIDANVGRLIAALERLGVADRTMIVYTSDHGDMQGSHGLVNKCLPHEESAGIPLIVHAPDQPPHTTGRVSDALVSGIDFMPTCLEMAGITPPQSVDGRSFAPLLRGQTDTAGDAIFSERGQWCMIVTDGWKLAADRTDGGLSPTLMTHLDDDPYELSNRVDDATCGDRRAQMLQRLRDWDRDVRG